MTVTPRQTCRGLTLTEVLIASALAVVVIMGIGSVDVARLRMEEELKARSGLTTGQGQVALATIQFTKDIATADRLYIMDSGIAGVDPGGTVDQGKLRIRYSDCSTPACFDNAASYRWDEYRVQAGKLEKLSDVHVNCSNVRVLASEVGSLTFRFRDEGPPPPGGGEPFTGPEDNNALEFSIRWQGTDSRTHEFHSLAETRAISYSNVEDTDLTGTAGDSGSGVDVPPRDSPPPLIVCP